MAEGEEEIAFVGTTNLPWELDPAFLRRFEKKILLPILSLKERIKMLKFLFKTQFSLDEESFVILGELSQGLTGAEIQNFARDLMIKQSLSKKFSKSEKPSQEETIRFIKKVLKNYKPNVTKRMMNNYVKFLQKFGEVSQLEEIDKSIYKSGNLDYII